MEFIAQNWRWLAGILTIVVTFGGAFYKVAVRDSVKKAELYKKDGQPVYQHQKTCEKIVREFSRGVEEIKDSVETLNKEIQRDRIASVGFRSAVKEKLDLHWTVPK